MNQLYGNMVATRVQIAEIVTWGRINVSILFQDSVSDD